MQCQTLGTSREKENSLVAPHIEFGAIWVAAANVGQKKGRLDMVRCLSSLQISSRQNLSFLAPVIWPRHLRAQHQRGREPPDSISSGRILVTFTVSELSPANKLLSVRS